MSKYSSYSSGTNVITDHNYLSYATSEESLILYMNGESPNSLIGTKTGSVTGTPDYTTDGLTLINTGKSMTLDAGELINFGNDSDFNFGKANKWAVEFLVKPSAYGTVISKINGSNVGWSIGLDSDNRVIGKMYADASDYIQNKSTDVLSNGSIYHVLVQFSSPIDYYYKKYPFSFGTMRPIPVITITIDGKEQIPYPQYDDKSYATLTGDIINSGNFIIGSASFAGVLDEIAVYSDSLGNAKKIQQRTWLARYSTELPIWTPPATINLILDQDIDDDPDDAGDIHTAISLKKLGEINLLADIISTKSIYAAPVAQAISDWWDDDLLIAAYQGSEGRGYASDYALSAEAATRTHFRPTDSRTNYPDDLVTYRTLLADAEDNSVIIVTTGYLISVQRLMNSPADGISSSTGLELMQQKIHTMFIIDNFYPSALDENYCYNGAGHPASWKDVIENCPCNLIFSGAELAMAIWAQAKISDPDDYDTNPFRYTYYYHGWTGGNVPRPCWGPLALLVAARGLNNDFILSHPFTQTIDINTGYPDNLVYLAAGNRWFLRYANGFDNVTKLQSDINTIFNYTKDDF